MNTGTISQDLSTKAMLAGLRIEVWSGKKNDKKIDQEIAAKYGTDVKVGRYNKQLAAEDPLLAEIKQTAQAARGYHYFNTLPWRDDGSRILAASKYFEFLEKENEFAGKFNALADQFCTHQHWTDLMQRAEKAQGGMFNPADYPQHSAIRGKFGFRTIISPLPIAQDFRVDIPRDELDRQRKEIEQETMVTVVASMKEAYMRIYGPVRDMAERLKQYEEDSEGKVVKTFRDSVVGNLNEVLDVLPHLNIMGDPELNNLALEVRESLCKHTGQELRDNYLYRNETAIRAEEIARKMEQFFGGMPS